MYVYDTNEGHEKAWHRKTQGKRVFQTSAGSRKGQEKKRTTTTTTVESGGRRTEVVN